MAIPTVNAVGAVASATTGSVAVGLPAGFAADDIHVLFIEAANEPINAVAGWSNVGAGVVSQAGGLVTNLTIRWRRAVGGDTAPTISATPQNHLLARIIGVRGALATGDPWDVTSFTTENVSDTSVSTPTLTTTVAECLVFGAVATGQDTATAQVSGGTWTNASLVSPTSRINDWTASGNGGGVGVMTGGKTTAGAVNASTCTLAVANFKALFSGALRPAAVVPGVDQVVFKRRRKYYSGLYMR